MPPSPRQGFEENIRPAELLVKVYRLLENDQIETEGDLMNALRGAIGARTEEDLMLIVNEVFLGLVRERAQLHPHMLRRTALDNLLRQAVVASCTALETYLPSLLRVNLPVVIKARGRAFLPEDRELREFFKNVTFSLDEALRIVGDPEAAVFIANKLLSSLKFNYLGSHKGVHVAGSLLGIPDPWRRLGDRLDRDPEDLKGHAQGGDRPPERHSPPFGPRPERPRGRPAGNRLLVVAPGRRYDPSRVHGAR